MKIAKPNTLATYKEVKMSVKVFMAAIVSVALMGSCHKVPDPKIFSDKELITIVINMLNENDIRAGEEKYKIEISHLAT
jgi:hypothetical protein